MLYQEDVGVFVIMVAEMFCQLAHGMHEVVAECNYVNDAGEELPLVLPHHLVWVDVRTFSSIVNVHKICVQAKFNEQQIDELNQQFVMFLQAYREGGVFKGTIEHGNKFKTDFKEA